jgi:N-acetyl-gamma-glutamyl-phosphate reductase
MMRVSIVGAAGYTGGELLRLLARHPRARVRRVTSESAAGKPLGRVHADLATVYDLVLEKLDPTRLARETDIVFFGLPHGVAGKVAPVFLKAGAKVVDLSADFRLRDPGLYRAWYKTRAPAASFLKKAVYGLPELFRDKIPGAALIANPGCYATASILALTPLLRRNWVEADSVVVDAKSGVSGAGKKLDPLYLFNEVTENFQPYAVAHHRHGPEIEQALGDVAGRNVKITFVPHLVPMQRGILVAAYARLKKRLPEDRLRKAFAEDYGNERFIRLLPPGLWPQTKGTLRTNFVDINLKLDERTGTVVVLSALDNLVKGAAGQAVQNMNLLFGWPETEGLLP